jgi:RNA polymerase sigma factor (sigma-70 family)
MRVTISGPTSSSQVGAITKPAALLPLLLALKERREREDNADDLLQELSQHLRSRFRGTIRRVVRCELAEEEAILNDALFALWTAASSFQGGNEGATVSYCITIVTNKTLDHIRATKGVLICVGGKVVRVPGYEEDSPEPPVADIGPRGSMQSGFGQDTPETAVERKQLRSLLVDALARLTPPERELIERIDLQGERVTDVAGQTGEQENTLTQRRRRALRKLQQFLPAEL